MGPDHERALGLDAAILGQKRTQIGIGVEKPDRFMPCGAA
jgi:hypothetical protein